MASIILVHGAWHGAWCWDQVVGVIRERGIPVDAVELPFTGFQNDVATVRAVIEKAGAGSVLCGHSYGGMVVSEAASERSELKRLIYLAALMTDLGESALSVIASEPTALMEALVFENNQSSVDPARAAHVFYGDSDKSVVDNIVPRLRPMTMGSELAATSKPAWRDIDSTYVVCTRDQAIATNAQRQMAARATEVIDWQTDHSPFLTRPAELADLLVGYL